MCKNLTSIKHRHACALLYWCIYMCKHTKVHMKTKIPISTNRFSVLMLNLILQIKHFVRGIKDLYCVSCTGGWKKLYCTVEINCVVKNPEVVQK